MKARVILIQLVVAATFLFQGGSAQETSEAAYITLANGMEVILKENHSSPMITSIIFVNAGARYEDDKTNGMTHLLEHLLFDGTSTRNRLAIT